jgi:prolyl oligopeptidase
MTKRDFVFVTLAGVLAAAVMSIVPATFLPAASAHDGNSDAAASAPPVAAVRMVTDEYFGVQVPDPYRYFEDLTNPEVAAWFKGQDAYTRGVLAEIPGRAALLARIVELDSGEPAVVTSVRRLPNQRYFYEKRLASEDVFTLYVRDGLNGADRVLVDPAKFATAGGPHYVISYYAPSFDGRLVVAGISAAGSEDAVLHVFDTSTGKETGDVIDRAQFGGGAWLPDGHSFLYNRLQKRDANSAPTDRYLNSRAYLHVLGTSPDQDKLVFGTGVPGLKIDPADIPFVSTVPGTPYVMGIIAHGVRNEITAYVAPIQSVGNATIPWKLFCDVDDNVTGFDVRGEDLYLISHEHASRFKVLHTKLANPDVAHAEVLVPPGEAVVQNIAAASDALYVQELNGGPGNLLRVAYDGGKPEEIALPFEGSVGLTATDQRLPGTLVELTSWTKANRIYAYDPARKTVTDTNLQPAGKFDDAGDLESKEVKVKSYDGTLVPLSIVYKKGVKLDGTNPTLLQGYGAYGITEDPSFDPRRIAWFERGGVLAVAHVRGGGEYGEDWHLAGKLLTKPNTWKDFIACAEYLIQQNYTATSRLAILGGSAGGITIGRSITERPDLFAVAIDAVPMSDAVRAEFTPNGPPNIPEFGTVKEPNGFKALYEMSAYHHIKDGTAYPAVMVTTGFNDPRVISWQPGKMAARLQAATSSGKPVLLRVDYDAGHGIGSTKTQREKELADEMSFQLWQFGVPGFQVAKK